MQLNALIFDGFAALDLTGGLEILTRLPGMHTHLVAPHNGAVKCDTPPLQFTAQNTLNNASACDVLYIPGGAGVTAQLHNSELMHWLAEQCAQAQWVFAVCNGVELLAQCGWLKDRRVSCNYFSRPRVAATGAQVSAARFSHDGHCITAGGVTACLDGALYLVEHISNARTAQLLRCGIEYYPATHLPEVASVDAEDPAVLNAVAEHHARQAELDWRYA